MEFEGIITPACFGCHCDILWPRYIVNHILGKCHIRGESRREFSIIKVRVLLKTQLKPEKIKMFNLSIRGIPLIDRLNIFISLFIILFISHYFYYFIYFSQAAYLFLIGLLWGVKLIDVGLYKSPSGYKIYSHRLFWYKRFVSTLYLYPEAVWYTGDDSHFLLCQVKILEYFPS